MLKRSTNVPYIIKWNLVSINVLLWLFVQIHLCLEVKERTYLYSCVNENFSVSNNQVFNNNSSVLNEVFKFLLDGRCNNYNSREWKILCKCQTKNGTLSDTPFLTVTAALLNNIIPIAIGRQRL